ncbi:serine/threonine protein kinase [Streptomyces sp. NRRL F-4489]|uniref:serine/threonine-protein kinase n=1 Tax=Streptomyces sp. NRRL F-4489 TaxID=1609095 RepID=UPI000746193F|nr:serine/threonine-protein kinase [Streptomyces sp. NRRL F-4489]KUL45839.1 serine/threonine protein kinase [Streptomyces sp. NRRL F-4489]
MGEIFAGRYELVDPIGRGGVGAVWRAWDHRRRRYVAAKVLQQSDAHTLLRFVREQALRIDHPHVLAPASWAADDDQVLFTMDLVHGGSLAHLTGDYGPLPARLVCTLMDQLLAGLTAVHAEGVVHRDIKPANILLEATGTGRPHLRLSDFGIAMRKGEPRLTEANYVVGTPGYFAPEQMLGAEPDFPADLFAAGLVALSLLTGAKPDTEALVRRFLDHGGIPNAPEDVPEPLWQVLASLLHPDPDARFKTATGARKALLAAAELLPELTLEDEVVEVFDHIGPLPAGFGPEGPLRPAEGGDGATGSSTTVAAAGPGAAAGGSPEPGGAGGATGPGDGRPGAPGGHPGAPGSGPWVPGGGSGAGGGTGAFGTGTGAGAGRAPGSDPGPGSRPGTAGFHLAPPEPAVPPPPSTPPSLPPPPPGPPPVGTPPRGTVPAPPATRPYTAGRPPLPDRPPAATTGTTGAGGAPVPAPAGGPVRKPGPPPKVAVPVLIVALLCIAIGVWALLAG